MKAYYHVYAGERAPFCQGYNGGSASKAYALKLYRKYVAAGWNYVELVKREWRDTPAKGDPVGFCYAGCCNKTLTTLHSQGK